MNLRDNTIWHLVHSSFALKFQGRLFIFDYYLPESERKGRGLAEGFVRARKRKVPGIVD